MRLLHNSISKDVTVKKWPMTNIVRFTSTQNTGTKSNKALFFKAVGVGAIGGIGLSVYSSIKEKEDHMINVESEVYIIDELPKVPITRKVVTPKDPYKLDLVLYQYQNCPFCCKVRAFLDSHGLPYSVVEVDAVLRQGLKWSPHKKVPALLARTKDNKYVYMTESSMIISALSSYLLDPTQDIVELVKLYPSISYQDDNGKKKNDVLNKYYLMRGEKAKSVPSSKIE